MLFSEPAPDRAPVVLPSSSPPVVKKKHDSAFVDPSRSSSPRGRSLSFEKNRQQHHTRRQQQQQQQLLSPSEATRPPVPRTPLGSRSKYRDSSSEYYTAAWGSPYEFSPSSSAHTAVSQQPLSEDILGSSPGLDFGLEHLLPSRLGDLGLPPPNRLLPSTRAADPADDDLTPRSRTKRWVQLPQPNTSEKAHWWSDESAAHSSLSDRDRLEKKRRIRASSSGSIRLEQHGEAPSSEPGQHRGHRSRQSNRTLDQQSFWDTLRGQHRRSSDEMSSLYESRWAATPASAEGEKSALAPSTEQLPSAGLKSSRWADSPSPPAPPAASAATAPAVSETPAPETSSLQSSRWAATPEAKPAPDPATEAKTPGLTGSRWADSPSPSPTALGEGKQETPDLEASNGGLKSSRWADSPSPQQKVATEQEGGDLRASRWADTPPPEDHDFSAVATPVRVKGRQQAEKRDADVGRLEKENEGEEEADASASAETKNEPVSALEDAVPDAVASVKTESAVETGQEEQAVPGVLVNAEQPGPMEAENQEEITKEAAAPASLGPTKSRLEAPRLRKKVSWRGKTCVISIPSVDYAAMGLATPLSSDELRSRMKAFEAEGYDTNGFDLTCDPPADSDVVHVKPIYPEETEAKSRPHSDKPHVSLPDLKRWAAYIEQLTEQKLAALGVTAPQEEEPPTPSQEMSRQSSAQYPPLPFSPPIPSVSAASLGRPGLTRGHSATMSVASPISPLSGSLGHMHRHSTFTGGLFSFPQTQPQSQSPGVAGIPAFNGSGQQTPQQPQLPGVQSFSPQMQSQFSMPGFERAISPQVGALRNLLAGARGPGSPLSQQILAQEYAKNFDEDLAGPQYGVFPTVQQNPTPVQAPYMSQNGSMHATPSLPQLPEEEGEEDELETSQDQIDEQEIQTESKPEPTGRPEHTPDQQTYVPPHKRAQLNANISAPTPRGHRHNISEGLERDVLQAEKRQGPDKRDYIEVEEEAESSEHVVSENKKKSRVEPEKDPLGQDIPVQETSHNRKKSASRFNATVPSFAFNPGASFKPGQTSFSFANPAMKQKDEPNTGAPQEDQFHFGHDRNTSSGTFNVAAPAFQPLGSFKPGNVPSLPTSDFNFSIKAKPTVAPSLPTSDFNFSAVVQGPSFKPDASQAELSKLNAPNTDGEKAPGIFGNIKIPDIVKPTRRSKAIAIVRPDEATKSSATASANESEEVLDESGRIGRNEDRIKKQRKKGNDDDEVPQFAEPTPIPSTTFAAGAGHNGLPQPPVPMPNPSDFILKSNAPPPEIKPVTPAAEGLEIKAAKVTDGVKEDIVATGQPVVPPAAKQPEQVHERVPSSTNPKVHGHKKSSSLSALAKPFEMPFAPAAPPAVERLAAHEPKESFASISELEEGELKDDIQTSPLREADLQPPEPFHSGLTPTPPVIPEFPFQTQPSERIANFVNAEPSFDEIDAVMRQINEVEDAQQARAGPPVSDHTRSMTTPAAHSKAGMVYMPPWNRSDAPSPSPRRQLPPYVNPADPSFIPPEPPIAEDLQATNEWPPINRLNKSAEAPTSDWSDILSPPDEAKLQQRMNFFDSHVDDLIGRAIERRLLPIEDSLRGIHESFTKRPISREHLHKQRSSSAVESDADDEDDFAEAQRQRPISRGRDKRIDQIKSVVLEALHEQKQIAQQQQPQPAPPPAYNLQEIHDVLADMKVSFARGAAASLELDDIRAVVDEVVTKQSELAKAAASVAPADEAAKEADEVNKEKDDTHQQVMNELEGRLNETLASALEEANMRRQAEEREAETRKMLRLAEEELQLLRDSSRDGDSRIVAVLQERDTFVQERDDAISRLKGAEMAQQDLEEQVKNLEEESSATYATLEEYRTSSHKWRQSIDEGTREREEMENMIAGLERQIEESQESGQSMRRRLERLHTDMAAAAGQLASEKAVWREREDDFRARFDALEVQKAAYVKERADMEAELESLRAAAGEALDARTSLDKMKTSNSSLDEMVRKLQDDLTQQQTLAARFERDFHEAKEAGRAEVERTRMALETDLEVANHQVNIVRSELESELSKVRIELESAKAQAETSVARHERALEEEGETQKEALRKLNHANSMALEEVRQKHNAALKESDAAHTRALEHAVEDKQRSEYILNERLLLADAKLQHSEDIVLHLMERLEVAKSAAQAAAMNAQSRPTPVAAAPAAAPVVSSVPERISPQALRESILVLQEQLQEREARIDKLQNQVDKEGPVKLKARDDEIAWLRELLAVRGEELTGLINTLSQPTFDRDDVRDTAIRIRANLQMEQQEKERFGAGSPQTLSGQAIASLSSFATPKASQLSSAFNKWRVNMESSALKNAPKYNSRQRSNTPSKPPPPSSSSAPLGYSLGLMTPPASNLRNTPSPEATTTSVPAPRLNSHSGPKSVALPAVDGAASPQRPRSRQPSTTASEAPTTPLFRSQSYDQDADDNKVSMTSFEDEDEDEDEDLNDVADSEPPAFRSRSLEEEMEAEGEEEEEEPSAADDSA